jgi:hypothetical protein
LEPNRQEFLNKAMGLTFENKELLTLIDSFQAQQPSAMSEEHNCNLPRDILFEDLNECWLKLEQSGQ